MIDTHCHLWFDHFDKDRDAVIQRAHDAGVHTMIQVGCDEASSRKALQLAERHEGMYATVGLHPNDFGHWNEGKAVGWMRELLRSSKKVVGIGETGLDYYRSAEHAGIQETMLRAHGELAKEFDLPLIIHLRATKLPKEGSEGLNQVENDVLRILDDVGVGPGKALFHCFAGDRRFAEEVLKRGWIISFSGVVTYPNAEELREVVKMCPMDRIVVETDCPFLSPQGHRGDRNEPSFVVETAEMVAELRGVSVETMERQTDENARKLFGLK
ncbi:MAG: TatD family hydrolase [Candidatus Altimarinota bacterium]